MKHIEAQISALDALSPEALRQRWTALTGRPVPRIGPSMLRLALAWEIQAKAHGGMPRKLTTRLDQLGRGLTQTAPTRAGMRLVREWGGKTHVVIVGEDQVIRWEDREYRSLSEVARAITGTRWSGPAFFGLKSTKKAA